MSLPRTFRKLFTVVLFAAPAFALASPTANASDKSPHKKPVVVSTNTLLDDFARTLGADAIDARCLLSPGRDPHNFSPTPADVRLLSQADLVIVNGLGFESWLDKLIQNSGFRGPLATASHGITPLRSRPDDSHDHAHDHHGHDHHDHGEIDPHAWHDLRHAARYVENIRDALAALAPDHAAAIRARAATYLTEFATLDAQFRERLAQLPPKHRKLVTSHDSLRYLGHAYGLEIIPISGLRPDHEPSAKQLAAIVKLLRRENIPAVFIESTTNPKIPALLAKEAGVTVVSELYTDSLGAPGSSAATFLGMARANLETLTTSLR